MLFLFLFLFLSLFLLSVLLSLLLFSCDDCVEHQNCTILDQVQYSFHTVIYGTIFINNDSLLGPEALRAARYFIYVQDIFTLACANIENLSETTIYTYICISYS